LNSVRRLRPYFLYDRRLLGELCRVACRTLRGFLRATFGEAEVVPGVVASIQTFGSRVNWHPHLHLLVTDGAFRRDGAFLSRAHHEIEVLAEAFRRSRWRGFATTRPQNWSRSSRTSVRGRQPGSGRKCGTCVRTSRKRRSNSQIILLTDPALLAH
jgi:hypothetical protein